MLEKNAPHPGKNEEEKNSMKLIRRNVIRTYIKFYV